jgi:hypothetical protein
MVDAPTPTPDITALVSHLRGLMEKATPGPWVNGSWLGQCHMKHEHGRGDCRYEYTLAADGDYWLRNISAGSDTDPIMIAEPNENGPALSLANAALIVAAVNALPQLLAAYEAVRDEQKRRGDNHWETLRSIREIAQTSGDVDRIIQWVNEAGGGYVEAVEVTLAGMTDRATAAETALADAVRERDEAFYARDSAGYVSTIAECINGLSQERDAAETALAEKAAEVERLRGQAVRLWALLDDIDTLDDAARSDDAGFRKAAYAKQRQRFDIMSGEEWDAARALSATGGE